MFTSIPIGILIPVPHPLLIKMNVINLFLLFAAALPIFCEAQPGGGDSPPLSCNNNGIGCRPEYIAKGLQSDYNVPPAPECCICPDGYKSDNPSKRGVTSLSQCIPNPVDCGSGGTLVHAAHNISCVGCATFYAGIPNAADPSLSKGCNKCGDATSTSYCPGLTSAPVQYNFYASSNAAALAKACPTIAGNHSVQVSPPAPAVQLSWFTEYASVDGVITFAIIAGSLLLIIFTVARFVAPEKIKRRVLRCFRTADQFATHNYVPQGAELRKIARPLGGLYTIIGIGAFFICAIILILWYREANTTIFRAATLLTEASTTTILSLPFKSHASWGSGMQVRVTIAGEAGKCAMPLTMDHSGFGGGASKIGVLNLGSSPRGPIANTWFLESSTVSCAGTGISQLVYTCSQCDFTRSSGLYFTFHHSCQSIDVQVGALDAEGISTGIKAAVPNADSFLRMIRASAMESLDVNVNVFHSVYNDLRDVSTFRRGYAVANPTFSYVNRQLDNISSTDVLAISTGGGSQFLSMIPRDFSVAVNILLPLDTVFAGTTVTPIKSITDLLASIVGLTGIVGFFIKIMGAQDAFTHAGYTTTDTFDEDGIIVQHGKRPTKQNKKSKKHLNVGHEHSPVHNEKGSHPTPVPVLSTTLSINVPQDVVLVVGGGVAPQV